LIIHSQEHALIYNFTSTQHLSAFLADNWRY
jgi:hypothetical protein